MARDLVIVGAGGFGREVAQLVRDLNAAGPAPWNLAGFVDDDPARKGTEVAGHPVLGSLDWLLEASVAARRVSHETSDQIAGAPAIALGVGSPAVKSRIARRLAGHGFDFPTLVHPSAIVGDRVHLGTGAIVTAGCILTTDIAVGEFVTLNLGCTVGHDAVLGDYATLAPGVHVSGNVTLGEGADLGTGSSTIQGVTVGRWSVVGAGGVVVRDLADNVVAVGIPARPIRTRDEGWHRE
jgi:sugar O-acyltransferase (sialic acid O-acetyltransferase NeuD family)